MSSAAGLSAAKRRRGASASQQSSNNVVKSGSSTDLRKVPIIPGYMPPIGQVLYVHEERLRRLEKLSDVIEGDDSGSTGGESLNREEFVNVVQAINTELGKMKQMVSDLQSIVLSNASAIKTASETVKDDVVADVTEELSNVTLTVGGNKKKSIVSSDN